MSWRPWNLLQALKRISTSSPHLLKRRLPRAAPARFLHTSRKRPCMKPSDCRRPSTMRLIMQIDDQLFTLTIDTEEAVTENSGDHLRSAEQSVRTVENHARSTGFCKQVRCDARSGRPDGRCNPASFRCRRRSPPDAKHMRDGPRCSGIGRHSGTARTAAFLRRSEERSAQRSP